MRFVHSGSFIQDLTFDDQLDKGLFQDSTVLMSRGDRTVILVGEDADRYTEIVSLIQEALSQRRPVSKRAIRSILDDFLMRMLSSGDRTKNQDLADQLKAEMPGLKQALLEKPKKWEVRLNVEGLGPSGLPVNVGQVEFGYLDETSLSRLKNRACDLVRSVDLQNKSEAASWLESSMGLLQGKIIGALNVNAVDGEAAIMAARHKLQTTIDAINFFASRERWGGWAFLPGERCLSASLFSRYLRMAR